MSVSVIITTKNEEKNIESCLKSIALQTYKDIEIIVVDNNSTDKTKKIAQEYTSLVFDKGPERSAQRNYGMLKKATGKYVMFVDADMIFSPGLVESCVETIKRKKCLALHIPEVVLGKNFFSKCRRFERSFYDGTVIDGARFFDKKAFEQVGGFDETMSGPEDWDIDKKIKSVGEIAIVDGKKYIDKSWEMSGFVREGGVKPRGYSSVIFHNESEFNLKKYLAKKSYYANSFDGYVGKWGKDDPDIKKQLGISYRFFGVFVENGKWKKLLSHPLLVFGVYLLRFMVGLKFITRKVSSE